MDCRSLHFSSAPTALGNPSMAPLPRLLLRTERLTQRLTQEVFLMVFLICL
jgi:hypothetical protein